jgi:murein DD-endopeptidase MepM/ murein hydrolase activator NlpD
MVGPMAGNVLRLMLFLWNKLFPLVLAVAVVTPVPAKPLRVSWTPHSLASGSPCLFQVSSASLLSSLRGTWQGRHIVFTPQNHVWYGLGGVDLEAKAGSYKLELDATLENGKQIRAQFTVPVHPAKYQTEALTVPLRFVEPDAAALRIIAFDRQLKDEAFSHQTTEPEWSGGFIPPIETTVSEGFGTRRTFNGKLASVHRGLDYHAKPGTPVVASNSGEVVLARELYYEGNCVFIDHGQGFMTIYMHLSHIDVSDGEKVEKGQEIGLSGATGRATGPHLHISARWQGAYLDPARLWALPLPHLQPAAATQPRAGNR